jgi:hypothetical protein
MNVLNYARKYFNKEHHIREKLIKTKTHVTEEEKREYEYYLNKLNIPYNISRILYEHSKIIAEHPIYAM